MTKGEIGMLVLAVLFGVALVVGMRLVAAGDLPSMTFWTGGVMGLMAVFGLIAAFGLNSSDG